MKGIYLTISINIKDKVNKTPTPQDDKNTKSTQLLVFKFKQ